MIVTIASMFVHHEYYIILIKIGLNTDLWDVKRRVS